MHPGGILLCAIESDRAPDLVAAARSWAAATRCRPVFVGSGAPEATGDDVRPDLVLVPSSALAGAPGADVPDLRRTGTAPLVVVPPGSGAPAAGTPIVCAVSLGDHDEAAVRFARSLAAVSGRRLALRSVFDAQDAASSAAARARSSVAGRAAAGGPAGVGGGGRANPGGAAGAEVAARADGLARRLLAVAREARAGALVVASRPGDAVSHALATGGLWAAATCAIVVVRP